MATADKDLVRLLGPNRKFTDREHQLFPNTTARYDRLRSEMLKELN